MAYPFPSRRALLLAAALLSACGAAGAPAPVTTPAPAAAGEPQGVFGPYLAGRFAQTETDTASAADRLIEALRLDPEQPEIVTRAFVATLLDGRPEAQQLARRLPDNQAAQLLLIGSEAQAGRWDRAEQRIRALPRQGPAALLQPLLLAWTMQGKGQTDQAVTLLRPLAEGGRLRSIHALHLALILDQAGRGRDAERYARMALSESQEVSLRLIQLAGGIMARNGREQDALRLAEQLGRGLGDFGILGTTEAARRALFAQRGVSSAVEGIAEAELSLAAALRGQANGEPGLILARLSLRLRPNFPPTLLLIAEMYADQRHPETALAVLETIPAGDPVARVAALRRAALLDRSERTEDAERVLRELARAVPEAPQSYARLGDMLRSRGRFSDAADAYDQAYDRVQAPAADVWPLLYARGIANDRAGRWARAEADFQRALQLSPEQPYVMNYLAYTWVERGTNLAEARRMLERAVELRPNDGNIVDSLGWALFKIGDLPGAVRWMERAVELEPRSAVILDHLGDVYWAAGRRNEARFQWLRALRADPEDADIPKIEAKLRNGMLTPPAATAQRSD